MVVYLLELLPFLYCFWRLYRYRTKLQTAQRMLRELGFTRFFYFRARKPVAVEL